MYVHIGCLHVGHGSPHYTADRAGGVGGPRATFFFTLHIKTCNIMELPPPHTHTFVI